MFFNSEEERYKDFLDLCEENKFVLEDHVDHWLRTNGFFTAPASTKYHGAYAGGLYDHSRCVYDRLANLTNDNKLTWQRPQSPFIIGMFHDLCKCDQYYPVFKNVFVSDNKGRLVASSEIDHYEYNINTALKGHATKSIIILSSLFTLTEEEMLCIRYHMGAYGNEQEQKDEWAGFDKAIRKYEVVLYAHLADQLASKVDDI